MSMTISERANGNSFPGIGERALPNGFDCGMSAHQNARPDTLAESHFHQTDVEVPRCLTRCQYVENFIVAMGY